MITGWEHSVESMQVGEMVDLKCAPEFAYGQQGSPPSIPPDATLTCGTLSKPRHRLRPAGSSQATVSARSRRRPRGASGRIGHSAEAGICIGICGRPYRVYRGCERSRCSRDRFEIELLDFHSVSIGEIVFKNGAHLLLMLALALTLTLALALALALTRTRTLTLTLTLALTLTHNLPHN